VRKAIEVHRLTKAFPKPQGLWTTLWHPRHRASVEALRGVTLSVDEGDVVGLLGPNGAGKTTLLKILCTLVLPTTGSATVNGHDVVGDPAAVRRSIGYVVADERSFFWRLTGRQNLRFFATLNNLVGTERERRIDELVEYLTLEGEADRPFQSYSTGTRQKLAIARGLLHDPPIVLLDEPTRSLDVPAARAVHRFVRESLVARGRTVLITTHNMQEAADLCKRVAVIDRGIVRAWGTPAEIATDVAPVTQRLLLEVEGWTEEASRRLLALPSVQSLYAASVGDGSRVRVHTEIESWDGASTVLEIVQAVVSCGGRIESLCNEPPSLAELFLRLTGDETLEIDSLTERDPAPRTGGVLARST
jgi:ABC-2 type transport system ATP-binding protein